MRGHLARRDLLRAEFGRPDAGTEELLAHAYRRHGDDLARYVLGEYACAIVDIASPMVLLAHDALGIVPLFYRADRDACVFATHLQDMIPLIDRAAIDEEYLADFMAIGHAASERTPFAGVRRVVPGEAIRWTAGTIQRRSVWSLAHVACAVPDTEEVRAEQLAELLRDAVRTSCDADEHVWCELSGGLDSSTVTALLARERSGVSALSYVYPKWPNTDERRYRDAVAQQSAVTTYDLDGCEHLPFADPPGDFVGEPSPLAYSGRLLRAYDGLMLDNGVDVVLTGNGGDEVLYSDSGIPHHLSDAFFKGKPLTALRDVAAWRRDGSRSWLYALRLFVAGPALRHLRGRQVWQPPASRLPAWVNESYRDRMHLADRCSARVAPRCSTPGRQLLADTYSLMALAGTNTAQRGQAYAVRHPLLSRPLVEYMACLPVDANLRPGADRILHRRAMRGILPETVRLRTSKSSGTIALTEGLRASSAWIDALSDAPQIVERGMVDGDRWRLGLQQARLGHTHGDRFLMAAISLETWFRQLKHLSVS